MWQRAQRPPGRAGRPQPARTPWPLKEVTGKLSRKQAGPPAQVAPPLLGASWPAGGKKDGGAGGEEKTARDGTNTQGAQVQRGLPVGRDLDLFRANNMARPRSGRAAVDWTRPGAAGLSAIRSRALSHRRLSPLS